MAISDNKVFIFALQAETRKDDKNDQQIFWMKPEVKFTE